MKKKLPVILLIFIGLLLSVELYLRFYWGFCDTVLTKESDKYEYIAQPNQNRFRFRKHIKYNEYSMRSKEIGASKRKLTLLGFGDSVLNGGVQTDQDSLATTIIENTLCQELQENIRCLNISYGSWGPDNCFAYLEENGDFDADLLFLVVSSHDAHDNMTFEKVVDIHSSYPSKQSFSAIYELLNRYVIPRFLKNKKTRNDDPIVKGDIFNSGFEDFLNYTQEKDIPFFIYLHPDKNEVLKREYDYQGKLIIDFCKRNDIDLIKGIDYEDISMFRDGIHLNEHGQRVLSNILLSEIERLLEF